MHLSEEMSREEHKLIQNKLSETKTKIHSFFLVGKVSSKATKSKGLNRNLESSITDKHVRINY